MFGYKRAASGDPRARRAVDRSRRARRHFPADLWHRARLDASHPRDSRYGRVADRRTRDRTERPPRRHRARAASFGDTFSVAPKSGACSRIPHSRAPAFSSTAATCKCTPSGATAIPTVQEIAEACLSSAVIEYAAVTDHSYGLKIAGGMSMAEAAAPAAEPSTRSIVYTRRAIQAVAGHRSEYRRCRAVGSRRR